jgi:hypothetical protein
MTGDDDIIVAHGGAEPGDLHLLATVHCVDAEIVEWLKRRDRRETKKAGPDAPRVD